MLRKILLLILVLTFILSSLSLAMASNFSDIADHENGEAIYRLEKLNILDGYPDGTFQPNNGITRGEIALIMTRINGLEQVAKLEHGRSTGFTDVPDSSVYSGYVRVSTIMEILTYDNNQLFQPEKDVLLEEIVAMVVRTLGYNKEGERFGSYPVGEKIMAHKYNLLDGLSNVEYEKPATRGQVAQILNNALEIPMMVMNSEGQWMQSNIYLTDEMALDEIEKEDKNLTLSTLNTLLY